MYTKRFMLTAAGIAAAAISGSATADITLSDAGVLLAGGEISSYSLGWITGTLTGITFTSYWEDPNSDGSWASDMVIGITDGLNMVSAGGYNMSFGGSWWGSLSGSGSSSGTFTTYLSGTMTMSGYGSFLLMNGWDSSTGTISDFTVTLHGINTIPAPSALALVGLAGIACNRRRRN